MKTFGCGVVVVASLLWACGGDDDSEDSAGTPDAGIPAADAAMGADAAIPDAIDFVSTALTIDIGAHTGTAQVTVTGTGGGTVPLSVGDLTISSVTDGTNDLTHNVADGTLTVTVAPAAGKTTLTIDYTFVDHTAFDGWMGDSGVSFLWPTFCGNLYPCNPNPADGQTFTMSVTGAADGADVIYPTSISVDAPAYMPAIAVADFTEVELGTTPGGVVLSAWHLEGQEDDTAEGTENLLDVMTFLETTYGDYPFGKAAGSVSANWGGGDFGGMEHHPFWHVSSGSMYDQTTHAHEAAHGWFGNGVRVACWEDFVLSEGTASYLAARALEESGVDVWPDYECDLEAVCAESMNTIALPSTCGEIDLLTHPLWSGVPYMKGAFFFKAVADEIGVEELDAAIGAFFQAHVGKAARMNDLIAAIKAAHADHASEIDTLVTDWLLTLACPVEFNGGCSDNPDT